MVQHIYQHRVRYRECDPMGVVYHTHYLDYFEAARTEALRSFGIAYRELEEHGLMMPVVNLSVQYRRPAFYDDVLEVSSFYDAIPETRIEIPYEVRRQDESQLLVEGNVTLCFVDAERRRPRSAPDWVRTPFEEALNGQAE